MNNKPLTVRIGYQAPNARLTALVGAIAKACAPAGITVQDVSSDGTGPQTMTANHIDVLLASTGGATGSGSSGSSAIDAYDLHTGNGNNLSGYSNAQIDGIIDRLAATDRPQGRRPAAGRRPPDAVERHADAAAVPSAAHADASKKMYAVTQQPDPLGRGLEHGPMGAEEVSRPDQTSPT